MKVFMPETLTILTGRNGLGEMINPGQQITRQEALRLFRLDRQQHQRVATLSGGEQQRVAIAAAAAREAPLVLADEPTAELDKTNERIVLEALPHLRDGFDTTVVIVTHSPRVAEAADRVLELRDGKLV
jgi:ABC-type lipoprotein export system ATPase subunit